MKRIYLILILFTLFFSPVLRPAQAAKDTEKGNNYLARSEDENSRRDLNKESTSPGRLRSCLAQENSLKKRMSQLVRLAQTIETAFGRIAERTEARYTNNLVPKGITVPNYAALVSDISVRKTTVQQRLTLAQTDVNNFSCLNGTATTSAQKFRIDMQSVKSSLKDFRTSVRNLITAVAHAKK